MSYWWLSFILCVFLTHNFDGLVQERCNSIANALELRLPCTNPLVNNHNFGVIMFQRIALIDAFVFNQNMIKYIFVYGECGRFPPSVYCHINVLCYYGKACLRTVFQNQFSVGCIGYTSKVS